MGTAGGTTSAIRVRRSAAVTFLRTSAAVSFLLALTSISGCGGDSPSTLDSKGPAASRIEGLWWLMFWISAVVFVVVIAMLWIAIRRRRRSPADARDVRWGEPLIVIGGVVVPTIVLVAVFALSLRDMGVLSAEGKAAELTIDVTGHDWWWEAVYEDSGAKTANEIHIPVGVPVRLRLTTDDVIHSFWVPQLQAKTDMIPGRTNEMWLQADEPGRYRGQCAEFCGLQHANMLFYVVAESQADFETWVQENAQPAEIPASTSASTGMEVFMTSSCVGCHAIEGTPADSDIGPDLTHLASRSTLAAGVLENTRGNLAAWIIDPQDVKPGAVMPPTELTPDELEALLDYLEQLD